MKITKQRLKEIIKEELTEAPEEGPPICEPASDREGLGWQIAKLLMDSDFGEDIYGAIVDRAYDFIEADPESQGVAVEIDPGGAPFRRAAKVGASKKQGDPVGFQETIRQMVRKVLAEHERLDPDLKLTDDQAPFVLRRSGAGADKEFFRILKRKGRTLIPAWSPLENAHKYKTADAAMDGKSRVLQHGHIPVTIVPIADVLTELEEARETAAQRTKRERAESRRKTQEKKADPRVQAVDRASQAHIAKEKEKREKREKKAKEEK